METSLKGMIELTGHEGICLTKYLDSVGVWTIGVGATISEIPDIVEWPRDKTLTMKEVFALFKQSLKKYERAVNNAIKVDITQEQFDALVSICYNIGTGWFGVGGHAIATFVKRINAGAMKDSIYAAIMAFTKPVEITARRKKEATLYINGTYQNKGRALLFSVNTRGKPVYKDGKSIDVALYLN